MRYVQKVSPSFYPILSFLFLILAGTALLLIFPTQNGSRLSPIDALFMATSATCVTGLSVVDIGTQFSTWGQLTILGLIQLGGLGIMTFSTVLILLFGGSITFRSRFVIQDVFTHSPQADLNTLLGRVLLFTLSFEAAATGLLFMRFVQQFDVPTAFYYALFHAVSAFCNAGFALFPDSFMHYRGDVLVNSTLLVLIVVGGIGFMVLHEIVRTLSKASTFSHFWNQLSLHTKMVILMTTVLLIGGTIFFLVSEWNDTLRDLSTDEKWLAAVFQSATPRTAGFNTLDFSAMNNITLLGTMMLMFIGASPGSTGGGIKTSSMGVLLALSRARISGSGQVHVFKRAISSGTINRAFAIFVISVMIVLLGTACLLITETGDTPFKETRGLFMEMLFEATSAFGTVGLSMGVTPHLSGWGKFILILIMYIGRLGPLVIAMAIRPAPSRARFLYAEERLMIG
ncbi:TrkH family potassium uptake protein [Desulfoferrobacter suflitae]|uniref:TrkH family potassium uptake protein n=1 Tax=Desulfoferrobacter suflitae TaxID=2865782 RepID=UPI002164DCB8|nr:TrkH family potassium uptake protein [Desulfoferrobacter suflitae]MCK8601260.1 TrkH family potassium uptake protein [Desulfoferrobacter suflitae]